MVKLNWGLKMKFEKIIAKYIKKKSVSDLIKTIEVGEDKVVATNGYWLIIDRTVQKSDSGKYYLNVFTSERKTEADFPNYDTILFNDDEIILAKLDTKKLMEIHNVLKIGTFIKLKIENEKLYVSGISIQEEKIKLDFDSKIEIGQVTIKNITSEFSFGYYTFACLIDLIEYHKIYDLELVIENKEIERLKTKSRTFIIKFKNPCFDFYTISETI